VASFSPVHCVLKNGYAMPGWPDWCRTAIRPPQLAASFTFRYPLAQSLVLALAARMIYHALTGESVTDAQKLDSEKARCFPQCERSLLALNCLDSGRPARQLSGVMRTCRTGSANLKR
jgi:hypothetical protein